MFFFIMDTVEIDRGVVTWIQCEDSTYGVLHEGKKIIDREGKAVKGLSNRVKKSLKDCI